MYRSIQRVLFSEIGTAILEYQQFNRSVRMISELLRVGTKRSIQEILEDDSCLSVNVVAALCKELADYLRLLHENYIAIDKICENNIYIQVNTTKVTKQFFQTISIYFCNNTKFA
jgi:hypothetical protein